MTSESAMIIILVWWLVTHVFVLLHSVQRRSDSEWELYCRTSARNDQ